MARAAITGNDFPANCGIKVFSNLGFTTTHVGGAWKEDYFYEPDAARTKYDLEQYEHMMGECGMFLISLDAKQHPILEPRLLEAGYSLLQKAYNNNSKGNIWLYGKVNRAFKEV